MSHCLNEKIKKSPRNTKKGNGDSGRTRARTWCLTINNFDSSDIEKLLAEKTKHLVFQSEVGESGTPHLQITIGYHNQIEFNSIKKNFPRAHIQKCKNLQASINYCSKEKTRDGRYYYDKRNDKILISNLKGECKLLTEKENSIPDIGNFTNPSPEWLEYQHARFKQWIIEKMGYTVDNNE